MSATFAETTVDHPGLASTREEPPRRRKARWVIALVVVLVGAGVAVAITKPFSSGGAGTPGLAQNTDATGIYTVARQDLSSQTQVSATLGYAGSYSVAAPSGASAQQVAQAQQAVAEDQLTLSADQQTESAKATADNQSVAAAQTNLNTAQSTLSADQATEASDCAGSGASSAACSSGHPEGQPGPDRAHPSATAVDQRPVDRHPGPGPGPGPGRLRPDQAPG